MLKGIDISYSQREIDYIKLKNVVDFIIFRVGYGNISTQQDKYFKYNLEMCKKHDIPYGLYWYSYADNPDDATKEVNACIDILRRNNVDPDFPVYFDIEEKKHGLMTPEELEHIIRNFCNGIEKAGFWAGVYSYDSLFYKIPKGITHRYASWVACTDSIPKYNKDAQMWQFSHRGTVNTIYPLDLNICCVNYPKIIHKNKNKQ